MNNQQTNIKTAEPETANSSGRYLQTMVRLHLGDCLDIMPMIPDQSIDAIITDPPYGTTACPWDSVIPFEPMWKQLNRIIKANGAIVLFGSEPFSSALRMSNIKNYKYDWIWDKKIPGNFALVKHQPLKYHEIISVFNVKKQNYFPVMREKVKKPFGRITKGKSEHIDIKVKKERGFGYPRNILEYPRPNNLTGGGLHPTQKPVALMEYLIKTYTTENETVLDFTMGSGTTGAACKNLNRRFIGIEKDAEYFEIAKTRIENHKPQMELL